MELTLNNVGIINRAEIKLKGLTVICGNNDSGKSTAGKALYATIESLSNLEEKLHDELVLNYRRALNQVSRVLDLDSISKYVDFRKIRAEYDKDFSMLLRGPYLGHVNFEDVNIIDAYIALRSAVEFLAPQLLLDFSTKPKSDLPKRFYAFLNNLEDNKNRALSFFEELDKYYFEDGTQRFCEKSVAALFSTEFKGQVFPVNNKSKERKSTVSISKNGEVGCSFALYEQKNGITATVANNKLFLNNAIYIDDPYALDRMSRDDDFPFLYHFSRVDASHYGKLARLLQKKKSSSIIEESINREKYEELVKKISDVIPGVLAVRDSGLYYEEAEKEPLKVQNLATGSKMFSILKSLLEKGEVNFDTMLILDEPESHLHPEWQNIFAEIIVLIVKEFDTHVMLTTHSPNFLMALEAYSQKYDLEEKTNYYIAKHNSDGYTVDYICVNGNLSEIYSSFAKPLVRMKKLKDE